MFKRREQPAGARQQDIARRVELGDRADVGRGDVEIAALGLEQLEQGAARNAEALGEHVARLAAGDIAVLERRELLLERLHVGPGDRGFALGFLAYPRGSRLGLVCARFGLPDPGLGAAEETVASGDPAAHVIVRAVDQVVAAGIDACRKRGEGRPIFGFGLLAGGAGERLSGFSPAGSSGRGPGQRPCSQSTAPE